jgi:hypothetical protein
MGLRPRKKGTGTYKIPRLELLDNLLKVLDRIGYALSSANRGFFDKSWCLPDNDKV